MNANAIDVVKRVREIYIIYEKTIDLEIAIDVCKLIVIIDFKSEIIKKTKINKKHFLKYIMC